MKYLPRPYQAEAIQAIWDYFAQGNTGNPVVALPTGTGKSPLIAFFLQEVYQYFPTQRVMMITHVKELIDQNYEKLMAIWPTAPAGIYSSGLNRKDVGLKITYGGIQSLVNQAHLFGKIDLIIIDECHLVSPRSDTSYQKFIKALKDVNPLLKVIGLSATPYRIGTGLITDGGIFTDICYDATYLEKFNYFIEEGYLVKLVPKRTNLELSTNGVGMSGGDYNNKQLQKSVDKEEITRRALEESLEYGQDRKHWLVFTTGVEHCIHTADMLNEMGISAIAIHSKLSDKARDQAIADYKAGKYQAAVNNNMLTTGFDYAGIDLIIVLRPTKSPGLWVQMMGRGTRPDYAPGYNLETKEGRLAAIANSDKPECLVLDFAGNTKVLGPINDPVIPNKKSKRKGVAPVRLCPTDKGGCGTYLHSSIRKCPECGYVFPIGVKFGFEASTDEIIASEKKKKDEPEVHVFKVDKVIYTRHDKAGKPPSMKATYWCGLRQFTAYVCLEHGGAPTTKAKEWWRKHTPEKWHDMLPTTTAVGLDHIKAINEPSHIRVWTNRAYPEILDYAFDGEF